MDRQRSEKIMNEKRKTGYLIKTVSDILGREANFMLKEQDLTWAQSRLIGFLTRNGGERTQKEIENFLEVSHPTVVGIVSRMEQNGFVSCSLDPSDRRNKIVSLTDKSVETGKRILDALTKQDLAMFSGFSEDERAQLDSFLIRIYNNLNDMHSKEQLTGDKDDKDTI